MKKKKNKTDRICQQQTCREINAKRSSLKRNNVCVCVYIYTYVYIEREIIRNVDLHKEHWSRKI